MPTRLMDSTPPPIVIALPGHDLGLGEIHESRPEAQKPGFDLDAGHAVAVARHTKRRRGAISPPASPTGSTAAITLSSTPAAGSELCDP